MTRKESRVDRESAIVKSSFETENVRAEVRDLPNPGLYLVFKFKDPS